MRIKTSQNHLALLLVAAGFALATSSALGQAPIISSLNQHGQLTCTNLLPGSTASVEWASSPTGPWTNNWAGLDAVTVNSNGAIQVSVPMFYRVRGTPPPSGMALIPAGSFTMGDTFGEGNTNELPLHTVYVSAFYMDKYEVTKALWDEVVSWAITNGNSFSSPGLGKATNHPVQEVTWYAAVKWCNAKSQMEGRTPAYYRDAALTQVYKDGQVEPQVKWNAGYRLPTEAEWEKAARGGASGHRFPWSDVETISHKQANFFSSSSYIYDVSPTRGFHPTFDDGVDAFTSPVGYFAANGYGLYDMAGNVWEWCWDWYGGYSSNPQTDPRGSTTGSIRVIRGGDWSFVAYVCRSAQRGYDQNPPIMSSWLGFRTVLAPWQ